MSYSLDVIYRTEGARSYPSASLDDEIAKAAGGALVGRGTEVDTGDRELSFDFSTRRGADAGRRRVKSLRHYTRTRIHRFPPDDDA